MRDKILLRIAIVIFAVSMGVVPAAAGSMKDFDVQKAETWADALAICDVTRFLMTNPNLDSEVIIAAAPKTTHIALYRPYFIPSSNFFSEVMQETFERVRKAGEVTPEAYAKARLRYARLMIGTYRNSDQADQIFLADQMRTCYALAVDTTGNARGAKAVPKHQ